MFDLHMMGAMSSGTSSHEEYEEHSVKNLLSKSSFSACFFIVAPHVPWCRRVQAMPGVKPQLYSDNLKC